LTSTILTLLSGLIWWVLYSSAAAILPAVASWFLLRWLERTPVVFNRAYFACLLWTLAAVAMGGLVIMNQHGKAGGVSLLALPWMRATLVADMLVGAGLLWWLVPRMDARRVRPTSACMTVAIVMMIALVVVTAIGR
jgi:hypothetical protein